MSTVNSLFFINARRGRPAHVFTNCAEVTARLKVHHTDDLGRCWPKELSDLVLIPLHYIDHVLHTQFVSWRQWKHSSLENTKTLFIFNVLTSFSLGFNFSTRIKTLLIFSVLTSFSLNFNFFQSNLKFVYFQRFDEFFAQFQFFPSNQKVCLFSAFWRVFFSINFFSR